MAPVWRACEDVPGGTVPATPYAVHRPTGRIARRLQRAGAQQGLTRHPVVDSCPRRDRQSPGRLHAPSPAMRCYRGTRTGVWGWSRPRQRRVRTVSRASRPPVRTTGTGQVTSRARSPSCSRALRPQPRPGCVIMHQRALDHAVDLQSCTNPGGSTYRVAVASWACRCGTWRRRGLRPAAEAAILRFEKSAWRGRVDGFCQYL